jgi:hypothetical protein
MGISAGRPASGAHCICSGDVCLAGSTPVNLPSDVYQEADSLVRTMLPKRQRHIRPSFSSITKDAQAVAILKPADLGRDADFAAGPRSK